MFSIGIVGPSKTKDGIGEFVIKYFHLNQAKVCGIVSSNYINAVKSSKHLERKLGIVAKPYKNIVALLENEKPRAIAICSPAVYHKKDLLVCAECGIHVFCEKPLIWDNEELLPTVRKIAENFCTQNLLLYQNTQWFYSWFNFEKLFGEETLLNAKKIVIELAVSNFDPFFILRESAPHANSILLAISGSDIYEDFSIETDYESEVLKVSFKTKNKNSSSLVVTYVFTKCEQQPRGMAISVDGLKIERVIDMNGYKIYLLFRNKMTLIDDPLNTSIKLFIKKIADIADRETKFNFNIDKELILRNFSLLDILKSLVVKKCKNEYS
jgi:hypothetical protein